MRGSVVGSGVVHLMLLVALFIVRTPAALVVPGPDVVQVALVDPGMTVAPAPPKTEPTPPPVVEEIKPEKAEGVKLAPEKKKPPPKKKAEESAPATAPALPSAPVGSAGLRGEVSLDSNFEFTYYLMLLRNKIASNWAPPAGVSSGQPVRAVVYFKVGRDGSVQGARLESSSGVEFFDRSAVRAVMISDPLPPLPLGYAGSDLGVHFGFEWAAP